MSHKPVEYPFGDEITPISTIDSWFNFSASNGEEIEKELEKAQLLLNHMDHIRTIFANKIVLKRRFK